MRLRARPELLRLAALAAIAAAGALTVRSDWHAGPPQPPAVAPPASGPLGGVRPSVSVGDLKIVVLRTPSVAQRVAAGRPPTEAQERSWSAQELAAQQQLLIDLASHGLDVHPDYTFSRVLDGFSARLSAPAVELLETSPEVAGVYPVSVAFPAGLSTGVPFGATAGSVSGALPGLDGAGVSIALLDTPVDAASPYLHGHVLPGVDVVAADAAAGAAPVRAGGSRLELHATELAGVLVGSGGPGGAQGVAPGARVLPIEVAGLQPDGHGGQAVYARSDQLIAGLERAVDPGGQGDLQDAVRVALVGLAEPYDGFADTPEAQAVSGALALGVLVVVPAGNDGAAGPWFGSVAGPGGSPGAVTVAAVDSRPQSEWVELAVRRGLDVVAEARAPLLDSAGGVAGAEMVLAAAGGSAPLRGTAALVDGGSDPLAAVTAAVDAGARAVILHGAVPSASALAGVGVPVLWVPAGLSGSLSALLGAGAELDLALGPARGRANPALETLAPFSSRGLAPDGLIDPELAAPGVELPTAGPGSGPSAFAAVTGTSAAAAGAAGAAALLAQARPALTAAEMASLLVGSARPGRFALAAGGTGVVDLGASAAGEVTASATSLGFGVWGGPAWQASRALTLTNVSTRRLEIGVRPGSPLVTVVPAGLSLAAGASATVRLTAAARVRPAGTLLAGVLTVAPRGGEVLRVPWTLGLRPPPGGLVHVLGIAPASFPPSQSRPAILRVALGSLGTGAQLEIEPAARVELRLYTAHGRYLGLLATETDLLPGRYGFAITGRGPRGARLPAGAFELSVLAWPALGGSPSRGRVGFRIE